MRSTGANCWNEFNSIGESASENRNGRPSRLDPDGFCNPLSYNRMVSTARTQASTDHEHPRAHNDRSYRTGSVRQSLAEPAGSLSLAGLAPGSIAAVPLLADRTVFHGTGSGGREATGGLRSRVFSSSRSCACNDPYQCGHGCISGTGLPDGVPADTARSSSVVRHSLATVCQVLLDRGAAGDVHLLRGHPIRASNAAASLGLL